MSRKHFNAIAAILRNVRDNTANADSERYCVDEVTVQLIAVLREANPAFDAARFREAAGFQS